MGGKKVRIKCSLCVVAHRVVGGRVAVRIDVLVGGHVGGHIGGHVAVLVVVADHIESRFGTREGPGLPAGPE